MYRIYWDGVVPFPDFPAFYEIYKKEKRNELRHFQEKIGMCSKCFKKGIEARIYRTWTGVLTQIQAGHMAESVFGLNTVSVSEELDHKGADVQVHYKGVTLNY